MLKSIGIGLLLASTLALGACSEGSTRSGFGDNANTQGSGTTDDTVGTAGVNSNGVPVGYVPAKIPCSKQSYAVGDCYDPTNPNQPKSGAGWALK